ncbi:DUF4240 domain-containing protein [Metabacillus iocasae]|uniref:DUF4240 domain-containing protein n=1 Tax=Priestia iocasae TaxID=2291674 RepID=A0ABS2QTT3_9BACI|nr:hypothetical protein [Metabacillus iocasae]
MNKQAFWQLIEQSRQIESQEEQVEWLRDTLSTKSVDEVLAFEMTFGMIQNESYQSSLWAAAYILMGGCSDDAFDYFCGWLISQGEDIYNKVIANHEYLAEYITEENLDEEGYPQNEDIFTVASDAYTYKKTGDFEWDEDVFDEWLEKLDEKGVEERPDIEFDWDEDDEAELKKRYPKLWARFGEEPLPLE